MKGTSAPSLRNKNILVVDDDGPSARLIEASLLNEGCHVTCMSSAEQALMAMETLKPDLIIVDLLLPGMRGTDFTRMVKLDAKSRDTVVVLVSSRNGPEVEREASEAGCIACWRKPIDVLSLPSILSKLL